MLYLLFFAHLQSIVIWATEVQVSMKLKFIDLKNLKLFGQKKKNLKLQTDSCLMYISHTRDLIFAFSFTLICHKIGLYY